MPHSLSFSIGRRAIATVAIAAVAIAATLTVGASTAHAQTIAQGPNGVPLYGLGKTGVATIGQTFLAPTTGTLDGFSFWLSNEVGEPSSNTVDADLLQFRAYVMQWDVVNALTVGPVLFGSAVQVGPTQLSQEYQFAISGLSVTANTRYVAFLSASGLFGSMSTDPMSAVFLSDDASAGGSLVFLDSQDDVSLFGSATWDEGTTFSAPQAQFRANFSTTVPEPSSAALTGIAVLGLMLIARMRTSTRTRT
jgi:hypothetical protein